ncbi:MAG: hypothetical protein GWM90_07850, partial [Gemmatimonadetes bacterium]|nr:hypothetical protein [Gemmatimonadota bacterium]NIQ53783.1 hypothetical protein [Gemmatimonadota bacterium]NIU73949.1 hypothetical protein [Gammaproteobacteria bacterium]NIX44025.1 hypothetical protein [Gemmatimonadota bacterium]NIY08236.1 hypothetical protein [Gemmatimonadota bacterium]
MRTPRSSVLALLAAVAACGAPQTRFTVSLPDTVDGPLDGRLLLLLSTDTTS